MRRMAETLTEMRDHTALGTVNSCKPPVQTKSVQFLFAITAPTSFLQCLEFIVTKQKKKIKRPKIASLHHSLSNHHPIVGICTCRCTLVPATTFVLSHWLHVLFPNCAMLLTPTLHPVDRWAPELSKVHLVKHLQCSKGLAYLYHSCHLIESVD